MRTGSLGSTGLPVTPVGRGLAALGRPAYIDLGSLDALRHQLGETRALLGDHLDLYQVHSATLDGGVLSDRAVLAEAKAAGWGVIVKEAVANGRLSPRGDTPAALRRVAARPLLGDPCRPSLVVSERRLIMDLGLEGRVALVTASSKGLGRASAFQVDGATAVGLL